MTRSYPPYDFGHRLLSDTLGDLAHSNPERLYATAPRTNSLADGFVELSFADMDRISNNLSGWIQDIWGQSTTFETIAYLGVPDLRAPAVFFAAIRSGYKLFLPSPRNPPEVNASLLQKTGCSKIIHAPEVKPIVDVLCKLTGASSISVAPFLELMTTPARSSHRSRRDFEDAVNEPILILHSSGSTGHPKPITMTNGTFAVLDNERTLPTVENRSNCDFSLWDFEGGGKFFTIFPYFHLAGFLSLVVNPVFTEASSPLIGPPLAPPSGALMKEILKLQKVKALYIPPSIAEQALQEPEGLALFKDVDFICYTGGPFSPDAGKQLVTVTDLVPLYGSTEAFQVPQLRPSKEDWAYMEWNPHFKHEMQPAEDGASEMVLFTDSSTEKRSALNHNLPGTVVWHTRDLFLPHPTKPDLWKYYGRRDDIIAFSNGEKFNPVPTELIVASSDLLSGALAVGQGRVQAALLLEPNANVTLDADTIIGKVWPLVERANSESPTFGQITRSKIIVTPPATFARAGKGTVIRKLSETKLHTEIEKLFSDKGQIIVLNPPFERTNIDAFVKEIVADAFPADIGEGEDLFAYGLDSLKSAEIIRSFKASLAPISSGKGLDWISLSLIYNHPSMQELSCIIHQFLMTGERPYERTNDKVVDEAFAAVKQYTKDLPSASDASTDVFRSTLTIALTGSTGALGSALLQQLLASDSVNIYCLNRRHDAEHESAYSKAKFLRTTLDQPLLGLSQTEYDTLVSEVDIIIHNAWQVDFALPFKAFDRQLCGVRSLVEWSLQSPRRPRIVFASSVSSAMDYPLSNALAPEIPEEIVEGASNALQTGYGISKQVAEEILAAASRQGADIIVARFGQIVQSGDFSLSETRLGRSWVSALFKTSLTVGTFPASICDVDWLSLEEAACTFKEIAKTNFDGISRRSAQLRVFNIVNAQPAAWPDILDALSAEGLVPTKTVALQEWVAHVEHLMTKHEHDLNETLPSARVLPFFRALGNGKQGLRYVTIGAYKHSQTLTDAGPVDAAKVLSWTKL